MKDQQRQATEAEAARVSGVYMKVTIMAQKQKRDLVAVGREAVEKGVIEAPDWQLVEEAISLS